MRTPLLVAVGMVISLDIIITETLTETNYQGQVTAWHKQENIVYIPGGKRIHVKYTAVPAGRNQAVHPVVDLQSTGADKDTCHSFSCNLKMYLGNSGDGETPFILQADPAEAPSVRFVGEFWV